MKLVAFVLLLAACDQGEAKPKPAPAPKPAPVVGDLRMQIVMLEAELKLLEVQIDVAVDKVVSAQADATRAEAKRELQGLQKQRVELADRLASTEAAAAQSRRVTISQACIDNPLAKGCM